ncbi:NEDD8-specific protease 2 [Erysiphe neolycopersici]|uniref:NEDD8-specific protease 2 n=1 Tax=Erysiphe neolycopersici TaxID=212602 RepID=A0A420HWG8_9PEZI|nr:NEDD8-specific protease 2 [Erysiphe neolycopersici]
MKSRTRWLTKRIYSFKLAPEDVYLSYYDIRPDSEIPVTKEDVDTLKNDWLTDNTIAFWEEYLEREELCKYPSSHIILLRPSMAFMLMQTPNPLTIKDALPDFSLTTHVFLPINDARSVILAESGSHWSLLLVSIIDGTAFHYDSLMPSNYNEARLATNKLSILIGRNLQFVNLDDSPQQENSSDCGIYVCIQMRHLLLKRILSANSHEKVSMSLGGKLVDANGGRKEILRTIEGYRKEGEKRRYRQDEQNSSLTYGKRKGNSGSPPRIGSSIFQKQ